MSQTTIVARLRIDGILIDADAAKLSDRTGTYGVRRTDTLAVVVADGTDMESLGDGRYSYGFEDPADGLTYDYAVEFTYGGEIHRRSGTVEGGTDGSENLYELGYLVLPWVGAVPEEFLNQALRLAAREFCKKTEIWVEDLEVIASVESQEDYMLESAYDATIQRVLRCQVDEIDWPCAVSEDGTLTLDPAPSQADLDIEVKVALLPGRDCSSFHAWFIDRWGDAVAAGAILRLKLMKDRSWTDYDGVGYWKDRYDEAAALARSEKLEQRHGAGAQVELEEFV